jgi:co-chaperonin GroES (HSP10)
MKLLHDYVAIKPDKIEEKTKSGIYMAEAVKTYPPNGKVVDLGEMLGGSGINIGDRVQYKVYASVDLDDETVVVPYSGIVRVL